MASNLGLYHPSFERDACGIGFVANIKGHKSHQNISDALTVLENMEHRGACGCENNTGDGAGIIFTTAGTAVLHVFQYGQSIGDVLMTFVPLNVCYETNAAGITLKR